MPTVSRGKTFSRLDCWLDFRKSTRFLRVSHICLISRAMMAWGRHIYWTSQIDCPGTKSRVELLIKLCTNYHGTSTFVVSAGFNDDKPRPVEIPAEKSICLFALLGIWFPFGPPPLPPLWRLEFSFRTLS